jgi:hypothetical protein
MLSEQAVPFLAEARAYINAARPETDISHEWDSWHHDVARACQEAAELLAELWAAGLARGVRLTDWSSDRAAEVCLTAARRRIHRETQLVEDELHNCDVGDRVVAEINGQPMPGTITAVSDDREWGWALNDTERIPGRLYEVRTDDGHLHTCSPHEVRRQNVTPPASG